MFRHRAAADLVRLEPVLDVGGGDGLLLRMLRERGRQALAMVDLSPVAVEKAREAGFEAEVMDLTDPLPHAADAFGTVCALDVLEHLHEPLPLLREIARVGREVVVAVPNFNYLKGRLTVLAGRVPFQNRPARGHVYWFNKRVLLDMVSEARLRVDEIRYEPSTRLGPLGRWLVRVRPSLFAASFAVRLVRSD